ncbi:MAG: NosD domain-containing protein [Thermoplasmata archaeon]
MKLESKTTKSLGLRNGRDNTRGFTNGLTNGFTNGNGYRAGRKLKKSRSHGKVLAVFVLAMLVVSVVAVLTWQSSSAGAIRIDGSFEDWQGVEKTTKKRDFGVPENIDLAEYATAETGKNVAFYAKVYGNLLAGDGRYTIEAPSENPVYVANQREMAIPNANGRDVAYVFVDADNNPATGFKPSQNFAVGAEKSIEIVGKNGKIEASRVLTFAGVVQQEWNWHIGESVATATNGKEMETMAGKNLLGVGENYAVYFYMIDWQNMECKLENALRCENARFTMFGLYLSPQAEVRTRDVGMEIRGTPHAVIHINGNADFATQATSEGWPGDGSQSNPYIIEGYEIDANGGSHCIWIENTNVYFVIRNCKLYNATDSSGLFPYSSGICLRDVQFGKLEANHVYGTFRGVFLDSSHNNIIINNNASGNTYYGIYLTSSTKNTLTLNNGSSNGYEGIRLSSSSNDNHLTNNNVSGNFQYGIRLISSNNNNITNNTVSTNAQYGIRLASSSDNKITYNWICNNTNYGVNITSGSTGNTIHHNNFIGNNGAGKGVSGNCQAYDDSGGNFWYDSAAHEGNYWSNWDRRNWGTPNAYPIDGGAGASDWYPIRTHLPIHINGDADFANQAANEHWQGNGSQSNPYIIEEYEIDGAGGPYCIWIENTTVYFTIRNCTVFNATSTSSAPQGTGIALNNVKNGTVENNICYNSRYGINLYGNSQNNIVTSNNVSGNLNYGIRLYSASNNEISSNYGFGGSLCTVYLYTSSNNNITNNVASSNTNYGIYLYGSGNNNITYNHIYGNANYGLYITSASTANKIHYNTFIGNKGASKGISDGKYQAYDGVGGNLWYDDTKQKGNYWSNWDGNGWGTSGAYSIDGIGGASDWYPLSLLPLLPLHINGNSEFVAFAQFYGWAGDGSQSNPYIIENYEIDANNSRYCIWIENTTVSFLIINCAVSNATVSGSAPYGAGIALKNVTNGRIENNTCTNSNYGIYFYSGSNNNVIIGNRAFGSTNGIYLYFSSNNTIVNTNASGNSYYGIYLSASSNNTITNNYVSGNDDAGIYLDSTSSYNKITSNILTGNTMGIGVYSGNYNTISNNDVYGNNGFGIYLSGSTGDNNITNNRVINNSYYGIILEDAHNNNIQNNTVAGNHIYGIFMYGSTFNNICDNNLSGNSGHGIHLYSGSNSNTITNNTISGNSYNGVWLLGADGNYIFLNNISNNGVSGIYLGYANNNIVTYNWICNNANYGVYITDTSTGNTIHHNNFIGNRPPSREIKPGTNCQAYDDVGGNFWCDNTAQEGNYWSNWDGTGTGSELAYPIDGGAGASDWYPLGGPVSESISILFALLVNAMLGFGVIYLRKRKLENKSI